MKTYRVLSLFVACLLFSTNLDAASRNYRKTNRSTEYPALDPLILHRWSARAMSGEMVSHEELMTLFEAARWAPSAANNQPWRFVYCLKGSPSWDSFFGLLDNFNTAWAHTGAALIIIISKKTLDYNGQSYRTHSFEAGAAWQNFALQASVLGLVAHAMKGFDYDAARKLLAVSDEYLIEAMAVVGRQGAKEDLLPAFQKFETPSDRKPLSEIVFEETFHS